MNDEVNSGQGVLSPPDLKHVFLERAVEVQYWSQRLGTSRRHLEDAVEHVGHHVNAIADYLERQG